jgi:hypothetical protein
LKASTWTFGKPAVASYSGIFDMAAMLPPSTIAVKLTWLQVELVFT